MAFSFGVAGPKPTPEQLAALERALPPLDSVQNILRFDSLGLSRVDSGPPPVVLGPIGAVPFQPDSNYWMAVKFTADVSTFTLQVVFYQFDNSWINISDGCSLYVVSDTNGRPDWPAGILDNAFIPGALPSALQSKALGDSIPFVQGKNFWILAGPVPGGTVNDSNDIGDGWWGLKDTAMATGRSFVSLDNRANWDSLPKGNLVLRAGGAFSPAPKVVINEVMFNPDTFSLDSSRNHEWVELFNPPGGAVQSTNGWQLTNGNPADSVNLPPSVQFPESTYLVIHLIPESGSDSVDTTFGDGRGDMYLHTGKSGKFFNNRKDACGLRVPSGDSAQGNIYRDVVAWNLVSVCTDCDTVRTDAEKSARDVGQKTELDKVRPLRPLGAVGPLLSVSPGTSIGRNDSSRNVEPGDPQFETAGRNVTFLGGEDAAGPTMGRKNLLPVTFAQNSQQPGQSADWTVILYMAAGNGRNSVESAQRWYFDLLNQIEREVDSGNVNVFVLFDSRLTALSFGEGAFDFDEEAGGTSFGLLVLDSSEQVRIPQGSSSVNTGTIDPLKTIITTARGIYTGSRYVLALKGDGAGWEGLCGDNQTSTTTSNWLKMGELKSVLQQAGLDTAKVDLLILDAPFMGQLEVATQVKDFAHFMVASPEMIGPADFDYSRLVKKLRDEPDLSPDSLAGFAVNSILAGRVGQDSLAVWTAIQLDSLDTLLTRVNQLAGNLLSGVGDVCNSGITNDNFQLKIRDVLKVTDHYGIQKQGMADFVDLKDFARRLHTIQLTCGAQYRVGAFEINSLLTLGGPVIVSRLLPPSVRHDSAGGLSIYFPSSRQHNPPIPEAEKANRFSSTIDHPFDFTGLQMEAGGITDLQRQIYAADTTACYPHTGAACETNDSTLARNHPFPPANLDFADSTRWDEFLIRYYKPAADAGTYPDRFNSNTLIPLNATGTSDADSDTLLLRYFWDIDSLADNLSFCDDSLDDLDKDCIDETTDEADIIAQRPDTAIVAGFSAPGTHTITLHVWDDHDLDSLIGRRQFQTAEAKAYPQVLFPGVKLVFEQGPQFFKDIYLNPLNKVVTTKTEDDLTSQVTRNFLAQTRFLHADFKLLFWYTGRVDSLVSPPADSAFPPNCRIALDSTLRNDNQGAWICAPWVGRNKAESVYFRNTYGFEIDTTRKTAGYLVVADSIGTLPFTHFLSGIDTLRLKPGAKLQSLKVACPTFPILKDSTGRIVAAARVLAEQKNAIVYCTFGMEHLEPTGGLQAESLLVEKVLSWVAFPKSSLGCPCANIKGDMDGNGIYTSADLVLLLSCAFLDEGACDICFADVNCDGILTAADTVLESNKVFLGLNALPWCGP